VKEGGKKAEKKVVLNIGRVRNIEKNGWEEVDFVF
jgi:hypothetical protein